MPTGDGRYVTIAAVQNYADSIVSQVSTWNTVALSVLAAQIQRAEAAIDGYCGTMFDEDTVSGEVPDKGWVDAHGWLHLVASSRGPVTAVTSIEYRMLWDTGWTTVTWAVGDIIFPLGSAPPKPNAWTVRVLPASPVVVGEGDLATSWGLSLPNGVSPSDVMFRWTYKGGYHTIPEPLAAIAARLTFFYYKLREAPLARILSAEIGLMELPLNIPPDIKQDLYVWRRTLR